LAAFGFGRRPLLYVAPLSLAGIRNPTQEPTSIGGRRLFSSFSGKLVARIDGLLYCALLRRAVRGAAPRRSESVRTCERFLAYHNNSFSRSNSVYDVRVW